MTDAKQIITDIAFELGFDAIGFSSANELTKSNEHFLHWREKSFAADMSYLTRENAINAKPKEILKEAKSVISLLVNYYTEPPPDPGNNFGRVAAYAVGIDYHKVLKKKIKIFQEKLRKEFTSNLISKGFSDSVPLLEKSFARESGLGFFGKNTLIINKPLGSYFFICEIIADLDIEPNKSASGTCGKCTRCIDICPTDALVGEKDGAPLLDARLCISYQTIENREVIPLGLRKQIGYWLFGCDLCQIVCPYNKKVNETTWEEFKPASGVGHWVKLKDILSIKSENEFHEKFCRTTLTRPKRRGLIRNAAIVAGNRKSEEALSCLIWLIENEPDPIIQEHVIWALAQYDDKKANRVLEKHLNIALN